MSKKWPAEAKVVSRRKGEMAGPCPVGGPADRDGFHFFPEGNFFCRYRCPDCPGGRPSRYGDGTVGWLKDLLGEQEPGLLPQKPTNGSRTDSVDFSALALKYVENLTRAGIQYLQGRGIGAESIRTFLLGQDGGYVTIPLIIGGKCVGIKKRYIGVPPNGTPRYTMVRGSYARALFNIGRVNGAPYVLIVEGILDAIALHGNGIPVVAPFSGGGDWDPLWASHLAKKTVIVVADNDDAGRRYAAQKAESLRTSGKVRDVIVASPEPFKDLGEMLVQAGKDGVYTWLQGQVQFKKKGGE